ncbi:MAG: hypothetical protein H8E44_48030 [Planctomycetes bacterium]|nr:hypothetical protein [Planctomycetota bacterium]MBL7037882.1 hypothetical protein [Pirellulaceae bacterium]
MKRFVEAVVFATWLVGASVICGVVGVLIFLPVFPEDIGRAIGMLVGAAFGLPVAWHGTRFRCRGRPAYRFRWTHLIPFVWLFDRETYTRSSAAGCGFCAASLFAVGGLLWFLSWIGALKVAPDDLSESAGVAVGACWIALVAAHALLTRGKLDDGDG